MKNLFILIGLALITLSSCDGNGAVEKDVQNWLDDGRERYVVGIQTGDVILLSESKYPHITYPQGGIKMRMNNVYLVNGGFMGRIIECQGCDSCMTCYQKAGLIRYKVKERNGETLKATVELTDKGKKYLIENYVGGHPKIKELRQNRVELLLVGTEKFELDVKRIPDDPNSYLCKAFRCIEMTPFLKAIGGVDRNENTEKFPREIRIVYKEGEEKPRISRID